MDLVCLYSINSLLSLQIIRNPTRIPGQENIFWVQVLNRPTHFMKILRSKITKKSEWSILKSTGGEVDNNKSHPGVAIYFKGADIGAVVSTGNWTWKVEVQGQRPLPGKWQSYTYLVICFPLLLLGVEIDFILNKPSKHFCSGQWSNIAIRWINLRYNDTSSYIKLRSNEEFVGGLEVIIILWHGNIHYPDKWFFPFAHASLIQD